MMNIAPSLVPSALFTRVAPLSKRGLGPRVLLLVDALTAINRSEGISLPLVPWAAPFPPEATTGVGASLLSDKTGRRHLAPPPAIALAEPEDMAIRGSSTGLDYCEFSLLDPGELSHCPNVAIECCPPQRLRVMWIGLVCPAGPARIGLSMRLGHGSPRHVVKAWVARAGHVAGEREGRVCQFRVEGFGLSGRHGRGWNVSTIRAGMSRPVGGGGWMGWDVTRIGSDWHVGRDWLGSGELARVGSSGG